MTDSATQLVITDTFSTLVTDFNTVSSDLGATGDLKTGVKTNVVASINELEADLFNVEGGTKRTLDSLTTTDKTCIVDAINELDAELGTITSVVMGTDASTVSGAIAEIEGVFDASAKGISAGSSAFDITTTHASGISLAAPITSLTGHLSVADDKEIRVGTGNDLKISHNQTNSIITNSTGFLDIRSDAVHIDNAANDEKMALFSGTSVDLYYSNSKKFETKSTGAGITGQLDLSSHLDMPDAAQIKLGNDDDLILQHVASGSVSSIQGQVIKIRNLAGTETMASFNADGASNLFYDNSAKLATTSDGIDITGIVNLDTDAVIKGGTSTAITLDNANVTIAGNTTVSGTLSVGALTTSNQTVKLAIDELHGEVNTNATNISSNDTDITNINTKLGTITTGVMLTSASNVGAAIGELHGDIGTNANNISTNTTAITANTNARTANTTAITANTNARTTNTTNIGNNATAITNNDSDISANATNISTNATNISTNSSAIGTLSSLDSDIAADGNLVVAINELQGDIRQINSSAGNANALVGTLAQLTTSAKNNCVVAINELDSDIGVNTTKLNGIEASADVTDTANVVAALTAGTNVTIAANGTISAIDTQRAIHSSPSENANTTSISSGWAFANVKTAVPLNAVFTDNNTEYSTADSDTLGLVKIGYSENGQNYPVELSSGKMFVNVPWNSDTNTQNQYQTSAVSVSGGAQLRLSGSGHNGTTTDNVKFASGGATTVSQTDLSTITITSTDTNTQLSNEQVQDIVGGMLGGTETGITVTYQDGTGDIDFVVATQTDNNFTTTLKNKLDAIEAGATADQTAAQILTAIKTVDGSGSGLDADLLDGNSSAHYATAASVPLVFNAAGTQLN